MSTDENKEIVRRYLKGAWDEGDMSVADQLLAPDFRSLNVPPGSGNDREAEKQLISMFLAGFGNFTSTFEDQVAEGDTVLSRWTATGTHQAPFFGVPATGRVIPMSGTEMATVRDGQIQDIHAIFDMVGLLQELGVVASPMGGPLPAPTPPTVENTQPTTPEENKAILHRLIEEFWNDRNMAVVDEIVHPEATSPSAPALPHGPQGFKDIANIVFEAFPDFHMTIDRVVAEGNSVGALYTESGTHNGPFQGIGPTGKHAVWTEFAILHIANGQIVESWFQTDFAAVMAQLGLMGGPGDGGEGSAPQGG
jgi:steroid delta-isomerase-like uncharacterized protein